MQPTFQMYNEVPAGELAKILTGLPLVSLTAISLAFVLLFFVAMGALTVAFVKAVRGGGSTRRLRQLEADEAKAFHELQRGFSRMQDRLESIETLYMGRPQSELRDRDFDRMTE